MLCAEWIDYMDAYRMYFSDKPGSTIAYADDMDEVNGIADRLGEAVKVK